MKCRRQPRAGFAHEAGYTLLEVVIAITLLAILSVVISGGVSFGARVWERSSRSIRSSGDLLSTYQFLDESLGRLAAMPLDTPQGKWHPAMAGNQDSMVFLTSNLSDIGLPGRQLVEIRFSGSRLEVELLSAPNQRNDDGDRFSLLDSVQGFSISYRGLTDEGKDTGWTSAWSNSRRGPDLVRMTLLYDHSRSASWTFELPDVSQ
jgi:general secretion pathway protein J